VGIYAEDPTLPEEEEIYAVDKTTIPPAADIAITIIAWTAVPSIPPFQPFLHIAKMVRGIPFSSHIPLILW
jgi:hypothetical protein